jgi:hypothetical protein
MPIDAHPTATRSTCERFWFALIVLARTASLPSPWYQHGRRVHPGDKANSITPIHTQLDQRTRLPSTRREIFPMEWSFFRRVAQIRHAGWRLTSAPHSNAAASALVGRQRRAADGDRDRGALEGLVQFSRQGLLENGNVLLQRCVQEANARALPVFVLLSGAAHRSAAASCLA